MMHIKIGEEDLRHNQYKKDSNLELSHASKLGYQTKS